MKNKMPMKYRIIFIILTLPILVLLWGSLIIPHNLIKNQLLLYGAVFSLWCGFGVGIYGSYFASKSHKNGDIAK